MAGVANVIDFSAYSGSWPYWHSKYASAQGLLELMERASVGQVAAASTRGIFVDTRAGNEEIASLARQQAGRVLPIGSVNPLEGATALAEVERCAGELRMKGLRLYPAHHGYKLGPDPVLDQILEMAGSLGLVVTLPVRLIMNWGLPTVPVGDVVGTVTRFPRCGFVLAGINYGELQDTVALLRSHENVCVETSCFQAPNGLRLLVDQVGAERVLLGLGLPLQYPSPGLAKMDRPGLSCRERELIASGNACRLLGMLEQPR